jgi:hypothetical protein
LGCINPHPILLRRPQIRLFLPGLAAEGDGPGPAGSRGHGAPAGDQKAHHKVSKLRLISAAAQSAQSGVILDPRALSGSDGSWGCGSGGGEGGGGRGPGGSGAAGHDGVHQGSTTGG